MQERFRLVETDFEESLPAIMKDLSSRMGSVMEQYQRQQEAGKTGMCRGMGVWVCIPSYEGNSSSTADRIQKSDKSERV